MNQLQIYIYGSKYSGFLNLNPGTTLEMEGVTELFDEDLTTGEYSLPIEIPWTANNKRLLGFAERIVNFDKNDYYWQCDVLVNGWPRITAGKLTLLEKLGEWSYMQGSFSASISGTKGLFGRSIKGKKLADLELGGIINYSNESREFAKDVMDGTLPQYHYIRFVPVAIESFFQTDRPDYDNEFLAKDIVNNIIVNGGSWVFGRPTSADDTVATTSGTIEHRDYRTVPFFKLKYVFKEMLASVGFTVKGDFIDDPDYDDLLIFNNYALERYTTGHADFNRVLEPKNHMPDMGFDAFLLAIKQAFRLKVTFTGAQEITLQYKYLDLDKNGFTDVTEYVTRPFKSILPGTERKNGYTLGYTWDSADQFITDRIKDLTAKTFAATVETRTELTTLSIGRTLTTDDYAYVEAENMYYLVADATNPADIKWDAWSENLDVFKEGDGEEDAALPISTLCQYAEFDTVSNLWTLRELLGCRQPGSYYSNAGNLVKNAFALRIFFGSIRNVSGADVPNSYNHNRTSNNAVFMKYTFATTNADGFFARYHKQWLSFVNNKQIVESSLIYNRRIDEVLKTSPGVIVRGIYFLLYEREQRLPSALEMKVKLVPL